VLSCTNTPLPPLFSSLTSNSTHPPQFNPEKLQAGGGSGLGLWITKGIVDMHHGTIAVHSAGEGHGCTFTVTIPMKMGMADCEGRKEKAAAAAAARAASEAAAGWTAAAPTAAAAAANAGGEMDDYRLPHTDPPPTRVPSPRPTRAASSTATPDHSATPELSAAGASGSTALTSAVPKYNLLIVDDSQLNRKMLVRVMKSLGHVCEEAEDGQQAADKVEACMADPHRHYDAILMDFVMVSERMIAVLTPLYWLRRSTQLLSSLFPLLHPSYPHPSPNPSPSWTASPPPASSVAWATPGASLA
jgi:hypothetical protein